jgi:uncharacterized protein (DUF1697 family)
MQRYIAFLSGLPTGPDAVAQDQLHHLFSKLGFLNIETHGTSGNVAFETAPVGVIGALEAQISRHLKNSIGGDIWTFLRTPEYLSQVVANAPFSNDDEWSRFVVLLAEPLDSRTEKRVSSYRNASESLHPRGLEIYWERRMLADGGSPLLLADLLDSPATVRSYSTITALVDQYGKPAAKTASVPTESVRSRR